MKEPAVHRVQGLLTAHRGIIVCPALDFRVQPGNEPSLRRLLQLVNDGSKCPFVTSDICFAWLDDGFEAEWLALAIVGGTRFTNVVLPHLKPRKSNPTVALYSLRVWVIWVLLGFNSNPTSWSHVAMNSLT